MRKRQTKTGLEGHVEVVPRRAGVTRQLGTRVGAYRVGTQAISVTQTWRQKALVHICQHITHVQQNNKNEPKCKGNLYFSGK